MKTTPKDEYFVTDDTSLAAYLYLNGLTFIEATLVNRQNPSRKKFVMHDSPQREELVDEFYARRTHVVPLDYHEAMVRVKRFLRTTVRDPRQ